MKFLLTSAGISNLSIEKALFELLGKSASETSVVFVLTAAAMVEGDKGWLIQNLKDFADCGFHSVDIIDIAAVPRDNWEKRFSTADLIVFGGGDEQYLARAMRQSGVAEALPELLQSKVYMGISAGSMVAGKLLPEKLIRTILPEEIFEGNDPGFALVDCIVLPHFNSDYFAHLRKDLLHSLESQFPSTVYALDDQSALKVVGDDIEVVTEGDFLKLEK